MRYSKHKVKPYKDTGVWADNEAAQKFKAILDVPHVRMYSGRRMFRVINRPLIRKTMAIAKYQ